VGSDRYTLPMRWSFFWGHRSLRDAGARFRAEHSAFLTRALLGGRRYPRIPTKRVDRGGWDRVRQTGGEDRFEQWWQAAFGKTDR